MLPDVALSLMHHLAKIGTVLEQVNKAIDRVSKWTFN